MPPVAFTANELAQVKEMAANPNVGFDRPIVDRVVRGLAARLTEKKNIQALLETPEEDPKAAVPKKGAAPKKPEGGRRQGHRGGDHGTSSSRSFVPGGPRTTHSCRATGGSSTSTCPRS